MPLYVEGIVDGGVDRQEALDGAGRLETPHLPFPQPHRLAGNLGPVVPARGLLVARGQAEVGEEADLNVLPDTGALASQGVPTYLAWEARRLAARVGQRPSTQGGQHSMPRSPSV